MTGILEQLRIVATCANQLTIGWAVIGGLAVSVHSSPRTTKDIDIAVAIREGAEQERVVAQLVKCGFSDPQLLMATAPARTLGIRLKIPTPDNSSLPLDILYASSGIEPEVVASAEPVEAFPGLYIPIASRAHLIAMKVTSENEIDRIQDRIDIKELLVDATKADIKLAMEALELITQRGFNGGKSLRKRFQELLLQFGYSINS